MTNPSSPRAVLDACMAALAAKDSAAIVALSDPLALFEIPMLKPNRLHGQDEVRRGLDAAFAELNSISFTLKGAGESDTVAIAEGTLAVTRKSAPDEEHDTGVVAELREGRLVRFSLYFNARNRRLWSDAAIL